MDSLLRVVSLVGIIVLWLVPFTIGPAVAELLGDLALDPDWWDGFMFFLWWSPIAISVVPIAGLIVAARVRPGVWRRAVLLGSAAVSAVFAGHCAYVCLWVLANVP